MIMCSLHLHIRAILHGSQKIGSKFPPLGSPNCTCMAACIPAVYTPYLMYHIILIVCSHMHKVFWMGSHGQYL